MNTFVRAVISGFGFSLGSALYKRVSKKIGLGEEKEATTDAAKEATVEADSDSESEEGDPEPA